MLKEVDVWGTDNEIRLQKLVRYSFLLISSFLKYWRMHRQLRFSLSASNQKL